MRQMELLQTRESIREVKSVSPARPLPRKPVFIKPLPDMTRITQGDSIAFHVQVRFTACISHYITPGQQ